MPIEGYPDPPPGVSNNASSERGWGSGWPACQEVKQRWINLSNGVALQLRYEVAELGRLLFNEALRRGYPIRDPDSAGYVCRAIAGTLIPSNHSWGLAADINWQSNPMGTHTTNIPVWMVELMWAYRWYWGGWYRDPDPMHFEFVGTPADAKSLTQKATKEFGMTQPVQADLVPAQENALAEAWSVAVALRDNVPTPVTSTARSRPAAIMTQLARIEANQARIEGKLDQILTRLPGTVITMEGTVRLVPVPATS